MIEALRDPAWIAAIIAAIAGLILVPVAHRIAVWSRFTATPRVGPRRPVAFLGGVAVMLAVIIGAQAGGGPNNRTALALLLATGLGVVGLVDDHRSLSPLLRLVFQTGAAALFAVTASTPLSFTGSKPLDVVLTTVWIVAVVNGVNFLDNSDALAACLVAVMGVGLALGADAGPVAVTAGAVAGACLAFLAYNFRPAAIYLGDAGSMFLGFVVASIAIELVNTRPNPASVSWAAISLLALPLVEIGFTACRRLAHGRRPWHSEADNLFYALIARGYSRHGAFIAHVVWQVLLAVPALYVMRRTLAPGLPVAVAFSMALYFAVATWGAGLYPAHDDRAGRRFRRAMGIGAVALGALCVAGAIASLVAYRAANRGANQLEQAVNRMRDADTEASLPRFEAAQSEFATADRLLHGPFTLLPRLVPGLSQNLRAAGEVASVGNALAASGARTAAGVGNEGVDVQAGTVPIETIRTAQPALDDLADATAEAAQRISAIPPSLLFPALGDKLDELDTRLANAASDTRNAADIAALTPALLGADGERKYLIVALNNGEARGTGGIVGSYGLLTAANGTTELGDFEGVEELNAAATDAGAVSLAAWPDYQTRYGFQNPQIRWENMTMTPDFPTAAAVMRAQYERQTGEKIDGVIAVDPVALRGLLEITGPVKVPDWPEPITKDNILEIMFRGQYERFDDLEQRRDFLGNTTRAIWEAFENVDRVRPARIGNALAPAIDERHLMVWLADPTAQELITRLGASGQAPLRAGDAYFTTIQEAAATKLSTYMRRGLSYDAFVQPDGQDNATVEAQATNTYENAAPEGLPKYVSGPMAKQFREGEMSSLLAFYSALRFETATRNGETLTVVLERELGFNVFSYYDTLQRGERSEIVLKMRGVVPLDNGWYRLDLFPQPAADAERSDIRIRVPGGYEIAEARGCEIAAPTECRRTGSLNEPGDVSVRIRATS